jgi:protease-4
VVYIEGDILEGQSANLPFFGEVSGHRTLSSTLETAVENGAQAIVLRVNSPGGSAWASEAIWRAIDLADEHVPVVVSMGNVAASGGYYVAAGGREILATDLTLTGSIGIFSGHFSANQLLESTGVHRFPILRGPHSNLFGIEDPWTIDERDAVMRDITMMYDVFIRRVADNRDISTDTVDSVARGRIWSGIRGEAVGLIDQRGSIIDALERAATLAGLSDDTEYDVIALPERSLFDSLVDATGIGLITSSIDLSMLQNSFSALGLDFALRFPVMYGDGRALARLPFQFTPLE